MTFARSISARVIGQASAWRRLTWAPRRSGEPVVVQPDEEGGQAARLVGDPLNARISDDRGPLLDGGKRQDRRRAREPAADARRGVVGTLHLELLALAEPALNRRAQPGLALGGDVEIGRRARSGIEVLVGASDGELDPPVPELDGDGAGGVAEVPDHRRRSAARDGLDVCQGARAIGDVGERHEGDLARLRARPGDLLGLGPVERVGLELDQLPAVCPGQALEHVAVGGEVAAVGDDRPFAPRKHG
jgi:hypothetical protein